MGCLKRFELSTSSTTNWRSNQLSYRHRVGTEAAASVIL